MSEIDLQKKLQLYSYSQDLHDHRDFLSEWFFMLKELSCNYCINNYFSFSKIPYKLAFEAGFNIQCIWFAENKYRHHFAWDKITLMEHNKASTGILVVEQQGYQKCYQE